MQLNFQPDLRFARQLDRNDPLKSFRRLFHMPKGIYFVGNSLGLQPKPANKYIQEELASWSKWGVSGHLKGKRPWSSYHRLAKHTLAALAGAKGSEVVAMNQLTVNLHLMMVTFYRPAGKRYKILTEEQAFSSDQYALESQVRFHGYDPEEAIVEVRPRSGEFTLRHEDIAQAIDQHGEELALVFFGGVHYYTGQLFDIGRITEAAHHVGALAGFDLAHAIGNVPLHLRRDQVDFAVWCGYKYLNSGPGGVGGAFIHERHANHLWPRFAGWWGYEESRRFLMQKGFRPMDGVDGWQLSNHDIIPEAVHLASLEIFKQSGMRALRKKSVALTAYLEFLLCEGNGGRGTYRIITPARPEERGCQLSIYMNRNGKKVYDALTRAGVAADWREPNVIRVAPVPLYNTYEEVYHFVRIFRALIKN